MNILILMGGNPNLIFTLKKIAIWSNRFNLLFFLKKPKNYKRGKQPVYMRITIDGARTDLSTQRECLPERWSSRAGRASGTKEEIRVLNAYLDSLQAKIYEAHRSLIDNKEPITIENFKRKFIGIHLISFLCRAIIPIVLMNHFKVNIACV